MNIEIVHGRQNCSPIRKAQDRGVNLSACGATTASRMSRIRNKVSEKKLEAAIFCDKPREKFLGPPEMYDDLFNMTTMPFPLRKHVKPESIPSQSHLESF
jgi:hypothetical protein